MAEREKSVPAVFKHYDLPPSTDGHFKAKCRYCKKELSGTTKSTTNWWKHLILSVKVCNPCINEINRLRSKFRSHLPLLKKTKGKKRKIYMYIHIYMYRYTSMCIHYFKSKMNTCHYQIIIIIIIIRLSPGARSAGVPTSVPDTFGGSVACQCSHVVEPFPYPSTRCGWTGLTLSASLL